MAKHSKDLAFHRRMHSKYAEEVSGLDIEVERLRRELDDVGMELLADRKNNRELGVRIVQLEEQGAEHLRDMTHCNQRVMALLVVLREAEDFIVGCDGAQILWEKIRAAIAREEQEEQPEQDQSDGGGCRCVVDMGKMRWVTVMDGRGCGACREMDGKLVTDERPPLHDCEHEPKGS